jgi:two-component system chemotaxis response regulator CheY
MKAKTILVIDDDGVTRKLSKKVLEGAGYEVYEAGDLKSAFEAAAAHAPHLIILDLVLPDGSGFDFLDKKQTLPNLKDVPVIVLSGLPTGQNPRDPQNDPIYRANAMGAKDYLRKPLDAKILVQKAKKNLKETGFSEYSFPVDQQPSIQVQIPGRILFANEVGFMLEIPAKIAIDSQVSVQSPLLVQLACQDGVFQKTSRIAKSSGSGQYINEIAAVGLGSETVKKIREITRGWR